MIRIPGFAIERELGRGGMAKVYLATQESLGRRVALKLLDPTLAASDPGFTQRFLREGRIAASLRHRHILAIHDVGVHEGQAYLALEYLPGGSLAEVTIPLPPREALRLVREMAGALQHAHAASIVHRDVKPENILRHDDGGFVLADFGVARMTDLSMVTKQGSTVGTPAYMAPEQWRNQDVDGRADLYSLGVVLYQVLTGEVPYRGTDGWAIGMQHMQSPVPRLPDAVAGLQGLLAKLMAKDPASRFANGAELVAAVEALERSSDFIRSDAGLQTQPLAQAMERLAQRPEQLAALFESRPARAPRRVWAASGLLLLLAGACWMAWAPRGGAAAFDALLASTANSASIAVLPCEAPADSDEHRLLGLALAEELIHRLGRLRALTVIARSSAFPLQGQGLTAAAIGERLRATHLLACSLRPASQGVRIAVELVETAGGTQRWSAEYQRDSGELLAVVDELSVGIVDKLLDNLVGPDRARLLRHRTTSLEAIGLVERGRAAALLLTMAGVEEGRALIQQALLLDPDYALAHVALAQLHGLQMQMQQRDTQWWRQKAMPLLQRALQIDPELPAAYLLRSSLRCAEHDWQGCRADLDQALAYEPGSAEVQSAAATFHRTLGTRPRAVEHALRLLRIDPERAETWDALVMTLVHEGRYDEALAASDRSLRRFPEHWPSWRARAIALEQQGQCEAGVEAYERALALAEAPLMVNIAAASLFVCAGQRERAQALLRDFESRRAAGDPVNDMAFAVAHLALGQHDDALDALEAMYMAGDTRLWYWLPTRLYGIEALAGEPRLLALLARLQLPDEAMSWDPKG